MDAEVLLRLRTIAEDMAEDEQRGGLICPSCRGGEPRDKSFSVHRGEGWVSFICHRSSCGIKGRLPTRFSARSRETQDRRRPVTGVLMPLPEDIKNILQERYMLDAVDMARLGAMWCPVRARVAYPIRSMSWKTTGHVFRSLSGGIPKALAVRSAPDAPLLSWYRNYTDKGKGIIVVEDQVSAARAASHMTAVALMGTNLNSAGAQAILQASPSHVVWCLDADAFDKGLHLHYTYGEMFGKSIVVKPPKDLKNMSKEELAEFMASIEV